MTAAWDDEAECAAPAGATVSMAVDTIVAARAATDCSPRRASCAAGAACCFVSVEVEDGDGTSWHRPGLPSLRLTHGTQTERRTQTRAKRSRRRGGVSRGALPRATLDEIAAKAGCRRARSTTTSPPSRTCSSRCSRASRRGLDEAAAAGPRAHEDFVARVERDPAGHRCSSSFRRWSARDAQRAAAARSASSARARSHPRDARAGRRPSGLLADELAVVVNALVNGLLLERLFDAEACPMTWSPAP